MTTSLTDPSLTVAASFNESLEPNCRGTLPLVAENRFEYPRYARCSSPHGCRSLNRWAVMKALFLCLAVALSGACLLSRAASERGVLTINSPAAKIPNPQGSVDLPKLGQVIFREQ